MPNIFDGYAKASDEQIADQVALLETITLGNVMKPYAQKTHRAAIRGFNFLRKKFGAINDIEEPRVQEVQECVEECRCQLQGLSRLDLESKLKSSLRNRTSSLLSISDEALSVRVVEESAKLFKIDENLTPAQKADLVYARFYERVLSNLQEKLKNQNDIDAQHTNQELDERLKTLNTEQRQKIQEMLKVDNLTGETMRSAILKAGAPAAILTAVSAAGFGGFVALSTIMHAVFTTVLGITLPFAAYTGASSALAFITGPVGWLAILGIGSWQILKGSHKIDREMLAQSTWLAIGSYGRPFAPTDEELPSWVPKMERDEVDRKDQEYSALVNQRNAATAQAETSKKQLEKLQTELDNTQKSLHSETVKRKLAEDVRKDLEDRQTRLELERADGEARVTQLQDNLKRVAENAKVEVAAELETAIDELRKKDADLQKILKEIALQGDLFALASKEITEKEKNLTHLVSQNARLQSENAELKNNAETALQKTNFAEESRRKELETLWLIHFPGFAFTSETLRDAAKLHFQDRCKLEKVLRELHESREPRALSRGKLNATGNDHLGMRLTDGVPARIEYRVMSGRGTGVEIVKFYKHNEKYMQ